MNLFSPDEARAAHRLVELALEEDLGDRGDVTSSTLIRPNQPGTAAFVSRGEGTLCGLPVLAIIQERAAPDIRIQPFLHDGNRLRLGSEIALVTGPIAQILTIERTALNFLQRLSGIATLTARFVDAIQGTSVSILDTRKTTPGWRLLEKYAVRCGGGTNHRMGLFDGVMIKDNHLAALGGVDQLGPAIKRCRTVGVPITVEVDTLEQLPVALAAQPDVVILDNMSPETIREAVRIRDDFAPGVRLEASGGVNLDTVRAIAEAGVDRISIGSLTHSVIALDIGLDYRP